MLTVERVIASKKRMRGGKGGGGQPKKRQGISPQKETQIRNRTCSAPWADVQFNHVTDVGPDGKVIPYCLYVARQYPPGGEQTRMCRCGACLAQRHPDDHPDEIAPPTPPGITGEAVCVDHVSNRMNRAFGASPSAVVISRAQEMNLRLDEIKLLPESNSDLRREIRRWEQRNRR